MTASTTATQRRGPLSRFRVIDAVDLAPRVRVRLDGGLGLEMVVAEVERGALRHPQVGFTVGGVHVWWLRSATAIVAFET